FSIAGRLVEEDGHLALRLFARSRYLLLLAALIALTQVVSTALDLRFSGLVEEAFPVKDERTAYLGGFYGTLNAVAALLQFVVAPVALRWLPLPMIHLGIPLVHLVTSLLLLASPSLHTGAAAYLLFKGLDYSLFRAGKEILYIPLTFDVRYRAKEVIDAFVYRFSKGALGMLLTGVNAAIGSIPAAVFPAVAALASLIWIPVVFRLTRQPEGKR
ncbi:MAG TPA: Npt1/Npt2 family nucleotide transporter, partial [Armatimonadota bacterium]|nr:Npt1/Npt2 family nucleotide transporter [Armatimonadota bacterium]